MSSIVKSALLQLLEQIEHDKGLKKADVIAMLEHALVSAYKKHAGYTVNIDAKIDPDTGEVKAFVHKKVVAEIKDPYQELLLAEAAKIEPQTSIGATLVVQVDTGEFARIAAQTAKQVLLQKIRETERETIYEEFRPKEGTIVTGTIQRYFNRNIVVDLGRVEAIIPPKEQVKRERWSQGNIIKAMVLKVEKGHRGPEVILSRAHPDFVKRLFEREIPEVYDKAIEVMEVARDPGFRTKVVVRTNNSRIDPVGACVGIKGSRIRPIIDELQGERIDLVSYSDDPAVFIPAALAPAKVISISVVNMAEKRAEVLVSDDMLSIAIGKFGQNVRLASKVTGWHIDVKPESAKRREMETIATAAIERLKQLEGVGAKTAEVLEKGGWVSIERLANAKVEDITVLSGIGEKTASNIIAGAKEYLSRQKEQNEKTNTGKDDRESPAGGGESSTQTGKDQENQN